MAFHIVVPRQLTAAERGAWTTGDERPRMAFSMLAQELGATIHAPEHGLVSTVADGLRAKLAGPVSSWTMARRVASQVGPDDVVFCGSESGGLQIAEACGSLDKRPKLCMFVHNLDRPRGRLALKLFKVAQRVDLLLACSQTQAVFLREYLDLPESRVKFIWDHTDTAFFAPGPADTEKTRPLIVSVGLEQRDYITLATATQDLAVDVRVSGFSEDAAVLARTFPPTLPANMERKFYSWPDLVQLYRSADVIVVSVHENKYAAGVQSLMEALACGRPVVATATTGLRSYLDVDTVIAIPPADAQAMRAAVQQLLADRSEAEARAHRSRKLAIERHRIEEYTDQIIGHLRTLQRS